MAKLIERHGITGVELIGFHGHTIMHEPAQRRTWQLGDGALLARLTGIDVNTGKPATSAGHLFLPIPCLDAGGLPDLTNQDCPDDEASRSWQACRCRASGSAYHPW